MTNSETKVVSAVIREDGLAMFAVVPIVATVSDSLFGHAVSARPFAIGLVFGALAYLVTGLIAALRHGTREGGGIAFAAATLLAVRDVVGHAAVPAGLIVAIALLAVGGAFAQRIRPRSWVDWYVGLGRTAIALAPGAIVLAVTFPLASPAWLRVAAALGTIVAGSLVHDFDAVQGPKGAPFVFLALATLTVYYTVAETKVPLVMLGCAIPLAFLSFPQPLRRIGPAGSAAVVGVYAWVVVVGGRGSAGSVVAALAALGLLIVEPLARRVPRSIVALGKPRGQSRPHTDNWILIVGVAAVAQVAFGGFCATIAGRETDAALAAFMTAPALVLLGAGAPVLLPTKVRGRHRPGPSPGSHRGRRSRRYAWMH